MKQLSTQHLSSSHRIGILTDDISVEHELPFMQQIWQKLQLCFESNLSSCCYIIRPEHNYFGTISIAAKQLTVGDSVTELTVGLRIDKILGADLAFEFKKYSDTAELGQLEPNVSKDDKRLDQILGIFNRRLLRHEFSHAKAALLNVIYTLTEQDLYEKPLKIDTLAEYHAFHNLVEEIQRSTKQVEQLEDLIPNILDYIEVQEELAKLDLWIKFYEFEVKTPTGKHLVTKLPIIADRKGQRLLVITKTDFVAIAHLVQKRKITRKWLDRYKKLPVLNLDQDLLEEFRQLNLVNFQIDKIGKNVRRSKRIKPAKFHPETSLAGEVDKKKSVTTHRLPTKVDLVTISQFAKLADFRICVGQGLLGQSSKFMVGNTIYHATYEHIGAYIFTDKSNRQFAYAFYQDEKIRKKIEKAVESLHPGDSFVLVSTANKDSYLPTLTQFKANNKSFV